MKSLSIILVIVNLQFFNITAFLTPKTSWNINTRTKISSQNRHLISLQAKKQKKKPSAVSPIISTNRQARRNYEVISTFDAGVVLLGSEIKAIRDGKMNLRDGFVRPDGKGNGMSLCNVHIGKHSTGAFFNHEERRVRPLLLSKEECRKLRREVEIKVSIWCFSDYFISIV